MKDDSLSDVAFCNTKEGMHIKAKELGISAYHLGCHCDECNKNFAEMTKAYGVQPNPINAGRTSLALTERDRIVWNEAIEAAAKACSNQLSSDAVRMLKK